MRRFRRDAKVEVASALMSLYPSALILRINLYLAGNGRYAAVPPPPPPGVGNARDARAARRAAAQEQADAARSAAREQADQQQGEYWGDWD